MTSGRNHLPDPNGLRQSSDWDASGLRVNAWQVLERLSSTCDQAKLGISNDPKQTAWTHAKDRCRDPSENYPLTVEVGGRYRWRMWSTRATYLGHERWSITRSATAGERPILIA